MIPPAYVISLKDDLGDQEIELNKVGIYPRIFRGVDGRKGEYKSHEDRIGKVCKTLCPISVKSIGLSHVLLCEKIYDENLPLALIFEDDAYPVEGLHIENEINQVLSEVPQDWDIIRLHCDMRCKDGSNYLNTISVDASAAAYIVSLKGAENIKNMLVKGHIDLQQNKELVIYKSKRNLFWTDESSSTNRTINNASIMGSFLNWMLPPTSGEKTWNDALTYKVLRVPIIGSELNASTLFIIFVLLCVLFYYLKN